METLLQSFRIAHTTHNGYLLSSALTPAPLPGIPKFLPSILQSAPNENAAAQLVRKAIIYPQDIPFSKQNQPSVWLEVFVAYWKVVREVVAAEQSQSPQWDRVYDAWKEVVNALVRGYSSAGFEAWTVPCLYVAGRWLRLFAMRADDAGIRKSSNGLDGLAGDDDTAIASTAAGGGGASDFLEDAARQINRLFSLCISDRAPLAESRKWALYAVSNLLFKTYFKLNSIALSKNILRSLSASTTDLPPLAAFPKSHIATFKYYTGVIAFLSEDYATARDDLTHALSLLPDPASPTAQSSPAFTVNRALILSYLIPCRLVADRKLPSAALLATLPPRQREPLAALAHAIRRGDLAGFDAALEAGQPDFVRRRVYLTLERARDVCLRNLFRKVFLAAGWEDGQEGKVRRTRVRVDEFVAAVRVGFGGSEVDGDGAVIDRDEVECLIANLIYKGFMKGYVSRERSMVVLSKGGAFPGTGV